MLAFDSVDTVMYHDIPMFERIVVMFIVIILSRVFSSACPL